MCRVACRCARYFIAAFVLTLAAACGGESGPGGNSDLASVDVTPDAAELFSAAPGNTVGELSFTSSAPEVATVSKGETVTGVGPGTAQITASVTLGGATVTGTTRVTVDIAPTQNTSATRTFASSGTFPYRCNLHAGMTGEVRVH